MVCRCCDLQQGWEDEEYENVNHNQPEPDFVYIDSHLLCNPVIGDLDGDGHDELVVAVSYFFDRPYYADPVCPPPPNPTLPPAAPLCSTLNLHVRHTPVK